MRLKLDVDSCSACGANHKSVEPVLLLEPKVFDGKTYTHFFICPNHPQIKVFVREVDAPFEHGVEERTE